LEVGREGWRGSEGKKKSVLVGSPDTFSKVPSPPLSWGENPEKEASIREKGKKEGGRQKTNVVGEKEKKLNGTTTGTGSDT